MIKIIVKVRGSTNGTSNKYSINSTWTLMLDTNIFYIYYLAHS